jgi:hypothetical protein
MEGRLVLALTKLDPPEIARTYTFPNGDRVVLKNVTHFLARESGTHRLQTADGKLHIVPGGWIHIELEAAGFQL